MQRSSAWNAVDSQLKKLLASVSGGKRPISAQERAERFSLKTFKALSEEERQEHRSWGSCPACEKDLVASTFLGMADFVGACLASSVCVCVMLLLNT